jgi:hypothetical protein
MMQALHMKDNRQEASDEGGSGGGTEPDKKGIYDST